MWILFCFWRLKTGYKSTTVSIKIKTVEVQRFYYFLCDSGGIRTHDLRLRRPLLYPAELLNRGLLFCGANIRHNICSTNFCKIFFLDF